MKGIRIADAPMILPLISLDSIVLTELRVSHLDTNLESKVKVPSIDTLVTEWRRTSWKHENYF